MHSCLFSSRVAAACLALALVRTPSSAEPPAILSDETITGTGIVCVGFAYDACIDFSVVPETPHAPSFDLWSPCCGGHAFWTSLLGRRVTVEVLRSRLG